MEAVPPWVCANSAETQESEESITFVQNNKTNTIRLKCPLIRRDRWLVTSSDVLIVSSKQDRASLSALCEDVHRTRQQSIQTQRKIYTTLWFCPGVNSPDQLGRAMVLITCSSLALSLWQRDCSSLSSADSIYTTEPENPVNSETHSRRRVFGVRFSPRPCIWWCRRRFRAARSYCWTDLNADATVRPDTRSYPDHWSPASARYQSNTCNNTHSSSTSISRSIQTHWRHFISYVYNYNGLSTKHTASEKTIVSRNSEPGR